MLAQAAANAIESPLVYLWAGLCGLALGSFLSVVVARLPRMLQCEAADAAPAGGRFDLAWPPSHCPACRAPLAWWHNLPLLGYLLLRGRCGHCGAAIPARYPLLELAAAAVALLALWTYGPQPHAVLATACGLMLLALAAIDLETLLLPDAIVLPLLWLGLLANAFGLFVPAGEAILGAAAGYGGLWLLDRAWRLLRRRQGIGGGDLKLLAALGAWCGLAALPWVLGLAALAGATVGLALVALGRRSLAEAIPFGPMLAAAGFLALLGGEGLTWRLYAWLGI